MSEGVIFTIGGILFIATTWATIAFLLSRVNELHRREVLSSSAVERIETDGLVERYVSRPDPNSELALSEPVDELGGGAPESR